MPVFPGRLFRSAAVRAAIVASAVAIVASTPAPVTADSPMYALTDLGSLGCCNCWIWESSALGLNNAPATPIFKPGRIVLQQVRHFSPSFNAALVAFVEAQWDHDADKNRLCAPNPYAHSIDDWPRMMNRTWRTEYRWLSEPALAGWVAESRLNLLRALPDHLTEPPVRAAVERYLTHVGAAIERLGELDRSGGPDAVDAVPA